MLLVRDPWGVTKWKGKWKKSDPIWESVAPNSRLSKQRAKKGAFFICYSDFLMGFSSAKICYVHDDYTYSALRVCNVRKNEIIAIQIEIPEKGEFFFSFCQVNARCYKFVGDYQYSNISMYLLREFQSGKIEYLKGVFKDFKEGWIRHKCVKGKYWLLLNPHWRSFVKQFVFSIYGRAQCDFQMVSLKLSNLSKGIRISVFRF